jgi:hypothetical protein
MCSNYEADDCLNNLARPSASSKRQPLAEVRAHNQNPSGAPHTPSLPFTKPGPGIKLVQRCEVRVSLEWCVVRGLSEASD